MSNQSILIMEPFNGTFFLVTAFYISILIIASLILKDKSDEVKGKVIIAACLITLAVFVLYKYNLSLDEEYNMERAHMGGFNWWGELPLHLCNINLILIPLGLSLKKKSLMNFCFIVAPLGAMMAILMPGKEFSGFSILIPRMIGYYGTHYTIVIAGLALATFGLCRPKFKDIIPTTGTLLLITFFIFLFNVLLRATGIYSRANYFFVMETEGNPLLEIFHSWIPYPGLYILPCTLILIAYMLLITLLFKIIDKNSDKDR